MRRPSTPDDPRRRLGVLLALLALSGCAQPQRTPPAERPYWRVEPRDLQEAPRLPSPFDAFRA